MARDIALDGATVYKVIVTTTYGPNYRRSYVGDMLAGTVRHEAYGPYLKASTAKSWGANEANRINNWSDGDVTATYEVVPGRVTWEPTSG